jgi:DNA-binding NarL/FixJ family response regulator
VRERFLGIRVLVLSAFAGRDLVQAGLSAGAGGYLIKDIGIDELAGAIRMAHACHSILAQTAAQALVQKPVQEQDTLADLTERQREVLALVAEGMSNRRIAEELLISPATARSHVSSILDTLGVVNRAEAAAVAAEYGLLKPTMPPAGQTVRHAAAY